MTTAETFRQRLRHCPSGAAGWKEFEEVCREILEYLFCPPLDRAKPRPSQHGGIDRHDVAFPNWVRAMDNPWGRVYERLRAYLVVASFKNYDQDDLNGGEVDHAGGLLNAHMGNLALLVTRETPGDAARSARNTIFDNSGKVVLFLTSDQLLEMLYRKERGDEPGVLITDLLDVFYLQC